MPSPFTIDERVRWSDIDPAGIIFYGAYVRLFELAEQELFRAAGLPYGEFVPTSAVVLPRAHLSIDFRHPARLDDALRIAAYVAATGRTSLTLHFDVWHLGARTLAGEGRLVAVAVDRASLAPVPLPPALVAALAPFTLGADAAREAVAAGLPAA